MADEMKNGATAILKVLETLRTDLADVKSELKADLQTVKSDVAHMKTDHAGRFDSISSRFTILETRFDGMERRVVQELAENGRKLDKAIAGLDAVDALDERVIASDATTSGRLSNLENRVDALERGLNKAS
jgi:hypothetical protein